MLIKQYFLSLMKDERNNLFDRLMKTIMLILSWIYTVCVVAIDLAYRAKIRKVHKVKLPVVSIGNMTMGGTGKTPFTIYVAEYFQRNNKRAAILIRGYGNDEARMLESKLPAIPVYVDKDRLTSAEKASREEVDVLVLDDGFQHRRIDRDINIVMVDGIYLFGNNKVLPRGTLREPMKAANRADFLVLTKTDKMNAGEKELAVQRIKRVAPYVPIVFAQHRAVSFSNPLIGRTYDTDVIKGKKVAVISAIGDPDYFVYMIERQKAIIKFRFDFMDHHPYKQSDIRNICKKCSKINLDYFIVTEKDYVKLKDMDISEFQDKLLILNITMDITEGKENFLARLNSVHSGQGA